MNKRLFIRACKNILKNRKHTFRTCPHVEMEAINGLPEHIAENIEPPLDTCRYCRSFFKVPVDKTCPCIYLIKKYSVTNYKTVVNRMLKIIAKAEGKK